VALQSRSVGDAMRSFWIPLHKLFDGDECLRDHDISVKLSANHANEKIRRSHLFFGANGHNGGWSEPDISKPPFIFSDGIAEMSTRASDGSWLLTPVPQPLVKAAEYNGKPLTFMVPETTDGSAWLAFESSLNLQAGQSGARAAPEYLHVRHKIDENGKEIDLNTLPDVVATVRKGKYRARHYQDFTGDGWIDVECSELSLEIPRRVDRSVRPPCSPEYSLAGKSRQAGGALRSALCRKPAVVRRGV
jgi:hypothetical protein